MCDKKPCKSGQHLDGRTWDALTTAGFSDEELHDDQPFGPVIHSYTRAQAIADGVLVDLTADGAMKLLCHEAGFKVPIAITATAYEKTILVGSTETPAGRTFPPGQDPKGRLWDVLMVLRLAIRTATRQGKPPSSGASAEAGTDRVHFQVSVWDGEKANIVRLWCHCGPGDNGEPVLTLMLEGED